MTTTSRRYLILTRPANVRAVAVLLVGAGLTAGCDSAPRQKASGDPDLAGAVASITAEQLRQHTEVLAADNFEGRAPGTRGDSLTVRYLIEQLRAMGAQAGNPVTGTYTQDVPLRGAVSGVSASVVSERGQEPLPEVYDIAAHFPGLTQGAAIRDAAVVFAGYGIVAPELGRDDYAHVDVRGKIVLLLAGAPLASSDSALLAHTSNAAKRAVAARKQAAAVFLVNEPNITHLSDVEMHRGYASERIELESGGDTVSLPVRGWLSLGGVAKLLEPDHLTFADLKARSQRPDFRPVVLATRMHIQATSRVRGFTSPNVIARLEGSDPQLRNEIVIYTAHWDHLGRDTTLRGDQVFNGAVDNAGGAAQLLEIVEAFHKLQTPPRRSIVFLFTTAEEAGLLGAEYYVKHPLYPLQLTIANLNLDWFIPWGRTRDMTNIGQGNTTLDEVLNDALKRQGRVMKPDPYPAEGYFLRSDQYPFARSGIPALFAGMGLDYIDRPAGWGKQQDSLYVANRYHKVSDQVLPDWNYAGPAEDAQALFEVGYRVAQEIRRPEWKPSTPYPEFRARWQTLQRERAK